jgi:hypothetical protein
VEVSLLTEAVQAAENWATQQLQLQNIEVGKRYLLFDY